MLRYEHILTPMTIKKKLMKTRIMSTDIQPFLIQGPESFPTENVIQYYASIAANGAGIVTCRCGGLRDRIPRMERDFPPARGHCDYDIYDVAVQNYFSQLAETIHFYDSLASISLELAVPMDLLISEVTDDVLDQMGEYASIIHGSRVVSRDEIRRIIQGVAEQAAIYQTLGFDCCELHMSYGGFISSLAMSPVINRRTDEYGGSFENRFRIATEMLKGIRSACGPDFIVIVHISGEEPEEDGYKIEDVIRFAKSAEGLIDIIQIRMGDSISAHPSGFTYTKDKPPALAMAQKVKESGVKMLVSTVGGFQDPDIVEAVLREGKVDIVAMARTFFSNWDNYYKCLVDEKGEDVVPCIRCLKCTGDSLPNTKINLCSVNPLMGIPPARRAMMVRPPEREKKVAVIGGGPAGMFAALELRKRGHQVTLFEKSGSLGGQLRHADYADFKWPVKDYKDYLIDHVKNCGAEILLNTPATPDLIRAGGFDAVVAALGAVPRITPIPGVENLKVWAPVDVFGRSDELGHRVVIIGGGETGTETGLYLARNGHDVSVISRQDMLAKESLAFFHYGSTVQKACRDTKGFKAITNAHTSAVADGKVFYLNEEGEEKTLDFDDLVIAGGTQPLLSEALAFNGIAKEFFVIGDARSPGSILTCTRTAFSAASRI